MSAHSTTDEVRGEDCFAKLAPEWWELWARAPSATPFQSPAWLIPWARHFARETAFALTLRCNGRLIGLLPLFPVDDVHGRRLLPMGAGISDYLDGVFAPDVRSDDAALLLAALEPWGALDLPQLAPGSSLIEAPAPTGWSEHRVSGEPCPSLPLPAELPPGIAQNLNYYSRRAARAGIVEKQCAGGQEILRVIEALFDLHAARWRKRGQSGVLADPAIARFHRVAALALGEAGLLRLFSLHHEGRPAAVLYGLIAKGRAYYYIGGFDPELSGLGLGTLLIGRAIAAAAGESAREFDFLRGREAYKYRWGAKDRPTVVRRLRAPGARAA